MRSFDSSRVLGAGSEQDDPHSSWDVFRRRSELDKATRSLSEVVGRMDRFVGRGASGLKCLFCPEMEMYRLKLEEIALKLLEMDPQGWGLKALEILWHKAFHSSLKYAFKKGSWDPEERARVQGLIWRAIYIFQGVVDGITDPQKEQGHVKEKDRASHSKQSLILDVDVRSNLLVKSLLYLGDLSRYCKEIDPSCGGDHYWRLSRVYYAQALSTSDYKAGMPYNQLGRLAENTHWGLPSAYYYLRSALSEDAFPGAEVNLKNLLSKNEKAYQRQMDAPSEEASLGSFVQALLHMGQACILETSSSSQLSESCQSVLALWHLMVGKKDLRAEDGEVATHAVAFLMAAIQHMEKGRRVEGSFVALARAALLAFFSHCVFKLLADMRMELFGSEDIGDEEEEDEQQLVEEEESAVRKKNILDRFRRKRRNRYTSSTEDSEEDSSAPEDLSSDDEEDGFVLRTRNSSFMDEEDTSSSSEDESGNDDVVIQQSNVVCSSKDLAKTLGSHSLAPAIRLLCLWVMATPEVVGTRAEEHAKVFWGRLGRVLALVDFQAGGHDYIQDNEEVNIKWGRLSDAKTPLAEDFLTKGLAVLSAHHSQNLDWARVSPRENIDLGLVRIKQLLEFRDWLAERKSLDEADSEEDKKHALMQNMAQLWLKQEVENLEEKDARMFSPYIIVDHLAMVKHLRTIKEIVSAKKFTVIIPDAVVQELDSMKRANNGARIAIRWLEWQFKQGNPWLRAQKKYESTALEDVDYPKRKNKEAWHYFEILECCNYFTRLGSTRTVTLLSPQDVQMDVNPMELAKCIGIRIEHVKAFRHVNNKRNKDRDG